MSVSLVKTAAAARVIAAPTASELQFARLVTEAKRVDLFVRRYNAAKRAQLARRASVAA